MNTNNNIIDFSEYKQKRKLKEFQQRSKEYNPMVSVDKFQSNITYTPYRIYEDKEGGVL